MLARGPQDDQSYRLRASLLAKAEDKTALDKLYDELKQDSASPDPSRRLLLGQTAEFLERHEEALDWYRSVAGGPQRAQARLRIAKVLHDLKRNDDAYADLRALQSDASVDDDARRDGYLLEAELRTEDHDLDGELDAYARGLAAYPGRTRAAVCARPDVGAPRRHRARRGRPAQDPGRRSRERRHAQRARLHARRPHHALCRGAAS